MKRSDDLPLDPELSAALEAIDATLAGEPVPPAHAEFAELALLLVADRPPPSSAFATRLDERVERRFTSQPPGKHQPRPGRWWLWTPAAGLGAAIAAAIVIVLAGGSSPLTSYNSATTAAGPAGKVPAAGLYSGASAERSPDATRPSPQHSASAESPASATSSPASSANSPSGNGTASPLSQFPSSPVLQPPANGRKIIQGGQLALSTASGHIDDVAQEIFQVVGQANGIVNSSNVTATGGPGGYAQFQLSIPSSSLPQAMAALSNLRYARVTSRTDTTQDVNDQYNGDVQRLADARALRLSLLKQLANAVTQGQIDSLTAQIHDAEAAISSDQATLRALNQQIAYSQVTVYINGGIVLPLAVHTGGGGFTFGKAAHDAGRVLTVAAGVALIGLAALVPISLVAALGWWIGAAVRRRRREQALDLV